MHRNYWFANLLVVWQITICLCSAQAPISLEDVTQQSGIDFEHFSGRSGKSYLVETVTAGLATFDYDNDGLIDIYFLNAAPLMNDRVDPPPTNRLFRNLGGMRFVDVTTQSGSGDLGFALGVTAGDFDNDGDQDLFVSNFGPNVLLENHGDGTFARHVFEPTDARRRVGAGVTLLDIDQDGSLDLFFANYVDFSFDTRGNRKVFGIPTAPGPKDYKPDTNSLYRNLGDGSFRDISIESGIGLIAGPGMGIVAFDFDGDQDTDVFVGNDSAANFLFENKGNSTFEEIGLLAGVAYDLTGSQQGTMGADVEKFASPNYIFRNIEGKRFSDVTSTVGSAGKAVDVSRGIALDDLDNDGDVDVVVLNLDDQPQVIQNTTKNSNHFLQIQLVGKESNRDAVGSLVTVRVGGKTMAQAVHSGRGYQSHFGTRLSFGVGQPSDELCITVQWQKGQKQEFKNVSTDLFLLLIEGESVPRRLR